MTRFCFKLTEHVIKHWIQRWCKSAKNVEREISFYTLHCKSAWVAWRRRWLRTFWLVYRLTGWLLAWNFKRSTSPSITYPPAITPVRRANHDAKTQIEKKNLEKAKTCQNRTTPCNRPPNPVCIPMYSIWPPESALVDSFSIFWWTCGHVQFRTRYHCCRHVTGVVVAVLFVFVDLNRGTSEWKSKVFKKE